MADFCLEVNDRLKSEYFGNDQSEWVLLYKYEITVFRNLSFAFKSSVSAPDKKIRTIWTVYGHGIPPCSTSWHNPSIKIRFWIEKVLSEKYSLLSAQFQVQKQTWGSENRVDDRENFKFLDLWIFRKVQENVQVQKQYFTSCTSL